MASSGKKKTTMAKLARESRLREKRAIKQAKKDARKLQVAGHGPDPLDGPPLDGPPLDEPHPLDRPDRLDDTLRATAAEASSDDADAGPEHVDQAPPDDPRPEPEDQAPPGA